MATVKLYKKSTRQPCYRLSYRNPQTGKWTQKLLHCSRIEADEIRKRVEAEYTWLEAHPELKSKSDFTTIEQSIREFVKYKQGTVKASTVQRYQVSLNNFMDAYTGDLNQINRQLIDRYRAQLLEDRNGRGVNAELRSIKVWLRYCVENEWLKMPKVTMAKEAPVRVRWLSAEQVEDIKDQVHLLNPEDREMVLDLITLLLQTGARANEVLESTWKQIDLTNGTIKPNDKGNTGKPLFLTPDSVKILQKYKINQVAPFPVNIDWLYRRYRKMASNAGETNDEGKKLGIVTTIHDLRRTCGAWLIQEGVDIYRVSKYLRHSSVTVTEKYYVDILPSDLTDIASIMGGQIAKIF